VLLVLAVVNFYLYTQAVMRRPALQVVIYVTSLADLMVITFLTLFSPQGGFYSYLYVFYFPALLVISVAFSSKMLAIFASAIPLYGLVALTTGGGIAFERADRRHPHADAHCHRGLRQQLRRDRAPAPLCARAPGRDRAGAGVCRNARIAGSTRGRTAAGRRSLTGPQHTKRSTAMLPRTATQQEEAEDIFFGQIVIVLARWFFLTAIMILALTATKDASGPRWPPCWSWR
jgi:hypothetical protein